MRLPHQRWPWTTGGETRSSASRAIAASYPQFPVLDAPHDRRASSILELAVAANPTDEMLGLLSGYWYSQVLYVLAELGIADCLAAGPQTAGAFAQDTHCHEATLYRFLRALASAGILQEVDRDRFALTPFSETLRSDRRDSLRAAARLGGHPLHWQAWGNLLHSVRTGEPAFDATHGKSFFEALATDGPSAATFQGVLDRLDHVDRDVVDALDLNRCRADRGRGRRCGRAGAPNRHRAPARVRDALRPGARSCDGTGRWPNRRRCWQLPGERAAGATPTS